MSEIERAYEAWKASPTGENRSKLRKAIEDAGYQIEGHGIIAWAKANIGQGK